MLIHGVARSAAPLLLKVATGVHEVLYGDQLPCLGGED